MKRKGFSSICFVILFSFCGMGQQIPKSCLADELIWNHLEQNEISFTAYKEGRDELNPPLRISTRQSINLQVVVHVVYFDEAEQISDLEIHKQIDVLNDDFNARNKNFINTNPSFRDMQANANIQFCLATKDPDNEDTNGITRTKTNIAEIGWKTMGDRLRVHHDDLGGKTGWDPERYVNIWICSFPDGLLGYGTYPGMANHPEEDGVVINLNYFFSAFPETDPMLDAKTLSHEMGHYLNLLHPWGLVADECLEDDGIEDTPAQSVIYYGCPVFPGISCLSPDLFNSFMNYCDDACLTLFTPGQVAYMRNSIQTLRPGLLDQSPCSSQGGISSLEKVQMYYNVQTRELTITNLNQERGPINLDLISATGKTIFQTHIADQYVYRTFLDIAPGVYFCRIFLADQAKVLKFYHINHKF